MKRWLLLFVLLASPLWSQVVIGGSSITVIQPSSGAPSGNCTGPNYFYLNTANGNLYTCPNPASTWVLSAASGSGTVNANGGVAGTIAYYPAAAGSTTVGPNANLTDAANTLTYGGTSGVSSPAFTATGTCNGGTGGCAKLTEGSAPTFSLGIDLIWANSTIHWPQMNSNNAGTSDTVAGLSPAGTPTAGHTACINGLNGAIPLDLADCSAVPGSQLNVAGSVSGAGTIGCLNSTCTSMTANISIQQPKTVTATNCAASGTAANPSVASCTGASAGSVACATAASTGTCTVNTTTVTANSEIFISQRTDTTTGTRLSVTCNTTKDTNSTAPQITGVVAATSFTFQLGTFATNPECFSYWFAN